MIQLLHDFAAYPFLRYAAAAALLAAVPAGIVGSHVVVRRTTFMAGAIAHCVLAGIGAAIFASSFCHISWLTPFLGSLAAAVLAALVIARPGRKAAERTDSEASAMWAVGMAVGVTLLTLSSGGNSYQADLATYLFGNILVTGPAELLEIALLDVVVVSAFALLRHKFVAIGFNPEAAALRGVNVPLLERVFLVLTALTVVILVQTVGIVLAIALLTLPASAAGAFARRLNTMALFAVAIAAVCGLAGIAISYLFDLPTGATIAELAGLVYIASRLFRNSRQ